MRERCDDDDVRTMFVKEGMCKSRPEASIIYL